HCQACLDGGRIGVSRCLRSRRSRSGPPGARFGDTPEPGATPADRAQPVARYSITSFFVSTTRPPATSRAKNTPLPAGVPASVRPFQLARNVPAAASWSTSVRTDRPWTSYTRTETWAALGSVYWSTPVRPGFAPASTRSAARAGTDSAPAAGAAGASEPIEGPAGARTG